MTVMEDLGIIVYTTPYQAEKRLFKFNEKSEAYCILCCHIGYDNDYNTFFTYTKRLPVNGS